MRAFEKSSGRRQVDCSSRVAVAADIIGPHTEEDLADVTQSVSVPFSLAIHISTTALFSNFFLKFFNTKFYWEFYGNLFEKFDFGFENVVFYKLCGCVWGRDDDEPWIPLRTSSSLPLPLLGLTQKYPVIPGWVPRWMKSMKLRNAGTLSPPRIPTTYADEV